MKTILLFGLLLLLHADFSEAECHHTIVSPKSLRINTPEKIYIDFHECEEVLNIFVLLKSSPDQLSIHSSEELMRVEHMNEPVPITVKVDSKRMETTGVNENKRVVKEAILDVKYCPVNNCGNKLADVLKIPVNYTHGYAFMTTSRPAYRPKDKVHFAIVATDQNLLASEEDLFVKIRVKMPIEHDNIVVHESDDLRVSANGFLEHEYSISDNPIKGKWWAETVLVDADLKHEEVMASTSFVIDKYATPTFETKIHLERHYVLPSQEYIVGTIRATYSYGKPVDGLFFLSMALKHPDGHEREFYKVPSSFKRRAAISNGEHPFKVSVNGIRDILSEDESIEGLVNGYKLVITATVTGAAESEFVSNVVDDVIFTRSPFQIDYSESPKFYVPNTLYTLQAVVKDVVTGIPLEGIAIRLQWRSGETNLMSGVEGKFHHKIDSFEIDQEPVTISTNVEELDSGNQKIVQFSVSKYQSGKQLTMRLERGNAVGLAKIGDKIDVELNIGQSQPNEIRLYVISRGEIVYASKKEVLRQGELSTWFTVTPEMVPSSRVLAYYEVAGEVTANSVWFDVMDACKHELSITLDPIQVAPKGNVRLTLRGQPDTEVYISGVDRAAYFVHNGSRLTRDTLWKKMNAYDNACSRQGGKNAANVFRQAGLVAKNQNMQDVILSYCDEERSRRKRSPEETSTAVSPILDKCKSNGLRQNLYNLDCDARVAEIIRNPTLDVGNIREQCVELFLSSCTAMARSRSSANVARAVGARENVQEERNSPRKDFAESWIFNKKTLNAEGVWEDGIPTRESITTYDLTAFGLSRTEPFCVAKPKEVRVFQNLFIQLYLPYSVRLREQATIRFALFNYGDKTEEVGVSIKHGEELCSFFKAGDFRHFDDMVIEPRSSVSSYLTILPLKIPLGQRAPIEIKTSNNEDWIKKDLLIEPRGQHNESYGSFPLDPEDNEQNSVTFDFDIAKNHVMPETLKCEIYVYAHTMGPSIVVDPFDGRLANLNQYIRAPYGCGEQNMLAVGPLVFIHKYRLATYHNDVTLQQKTDTIAKIQKGFEIELGHLSNLANRRAFAVWADHQPSTWLNGFVTKVFAQAREYWPAMDSKPICSAVTWMLTQQDENTGIFRENYRVHHQEMIGKVSDDVTRTAYMSISLSEVMSTCPELAIQLEDGRRAALQYVAASLEGVRDNSYALAMGAYALALSPDFRQFAEGWANALHTSKLEDRHSYYWQGTRGRAANIETTAHALLAEVTLNGITEDNEPLTRKIANWLILQRNDQGGFVSTQDTVVALQALSTYMTILESTQFRKTTDLTLRISSPDEESPWHQEPIPKHLTEDDIMKKINIEVPEAAIRRVNAVISGTGRGSMAYRCTWRQYREDGQCHFTINVGIHDEDDQYVKTLRVDVTKEGEAAQMSIIDISMLSGFLPDDESIKNILTSDAVDGTVDRYENTNNTVKLYISGINNVTRKFAFKIKEVAQVNNRQPAVITVYDYYEPEIRCTKYYSIRNDPNLQLSCEDGSNMCTCSEGDCFQCRTRGDQLINTTCSNHKNHKKLCSKVCTDEDSMCYNLHRETCDRKYVYIVRVVSKVRDITVPGFKEFRAEVEEAYRISVAHRDPVGNVVTFRVRNDCLKKCKDERFAEIARQKNRQETDYISVNRTLLVYGKAVFFMNGAPLYILDTDARVEIMPPAQKCNDISGVERKKCGKSKACKAKKKKRLALERMCEIKDTLKEAHNLGCD